MAGLLPEEGAQDAPAVERVAGQEVRGGDGEVPEADDGERGGQRVLAREPGEGEACERGRADEEARTRPGDGDAELGARVVGFASQARQPAERVKHDLVALDAFGAREERVRKLVAEDR